LKSCPVGVAVVVEATATSDFEMIFCYFAVFWTCQTSSVDLAGGDDVDYSAAETVVGGRP